MMAVFWTWDISNGTNEDIDHNQPNAYLDHPRIYF